MTVDDKESEIKFPENDDYFSWIYDDMITDWFKRCIEDFPEALGVFNFTWPEEVFRWKHKWFSQFDCSAPKVKEEGEK